VVAVAAHGDELTRAASRDNRGSADALLAGARRILSAIHLRSWRALIFVDAWSELDPGLVASSASFAVFVIPAGNGARTKSHVSSNVTAA
jgi:hypothetical protein